MLLEGLDLSNSANVVSASDHHNGVVLELNDSINSAGRSIELETIVDLNVWMGIPDGSAIVSDNMWDLCLADSLLDDLAELETGFFVINSMGDESTFGIQEDSEIFISLFNSNNVHGT